MANISAATAGSEAGLSSAVIQTFTKHASGIVGYSAIGGVVGGISGAFALAGLYVSSRIAKAAFADNFFCAALIGLSGLTVAGPVIDRVVERDRYLMHDATDRAIDRVTNGEPTATEPSALTSAELFGRYHKIGETNVTAVFVGTDGLCTKMEITKTGKEPYIIAVRPSDEKGGSHLPCAEPPKRRYD